MFMAILFHMEVSKESAKKLTQMVFKHAWLVEIDAALDNVDANKWIPMPQNYYMIRMHGREIMKFSLIRTIEPKIYEKLWDIRECNIFFLLRAIKLVTNFPRGWALGYLGDEDLVNEVVVNDEEDWELGLGEEWHKNDEQDPEQKAKSPAHVNCGPDCPVITDFKAWQK